MQYRYRISTMLAREKNGHQRCRTTFLAHHQKRSLRELNWSRASCEDLIKEIKLALSKIVEQIPYQKQGRENCCSKLHNLSIRHKQFWVPAICRKPFLQYTFGAQQHLSVVVYLDAGTAGPFDMSSSQKILQLCQQVELASSRCPTKEPESFCMIKLKNLDGK